MNRELIDQAAKLVVAVLLAWLDMLIAKAPAEYKAGAQYVRDQIAAAIVLPFDIVGTVLKAVGAALLSGKWGPASSSEGDL